MRIYELIFNLDLTVLLINFLKDRLIEEYKDMIKLKEISFQNFFLVSVVLFICCLIGI